MPTVIKKKMINGVASFLQYWRGNPVVDYNPGGSPVPPAPVTGPFYLTNDDTVPVAVSVTKSDEYAPTISLEVSDDGNTWTTLGDTSETPLSFTIPVGGRKYLRSISANAWANDISFNKFSSTGVFGAHGSVMELLGYDTLKGYDCKGMFYACGSLTTAPGLPATTTAAFCYESMFEGCTSLVNVSSLAAGNAGYGTHRNMFKGCTSLVAAPTLPATGMHDMCYYGMFEGCTSLTTAAAINLSYANLTDYAQTYERMFYGCTSLTIAPTIGATSIGYLCCCEMFYGCTSLVTAPAIIATTIGESGCKCMFQGCTSLTTVPNLPFVTLNNNACESMFQGCTSLVVAPAMANITTVNYNCCNGMFSYCTALTTPPSILPATTMGNQCYMSMFKGCTSLTYTPILPATAPSENGYRWMFQDCTSLATVICNADPDLSGSWCFGDWLNNVAAEGIFYKNGNVTNWPTGASGIPTGWSVVDNDLFYLTNDDTTPITVSVRKADNEFAPTISLETSDDGAAWTTLGDTSTTALNITIPVGGKKYLRSISANAWGNVANGNTFSSTGRFGAHGNIMKLLGYDALKGYDCEFMFENCSNLTTAPELPATTLAEKSYWCMFSGCTLLNEIKCNATDISATDCTEEWLDGVASSGTFYKNANMSSWTTGISGIPSNWTTQNISQ